MIDGDQVDPRHHFTFAAIYKVEGSAKGKMVDNQIGNGFIGKQNAIKHGCENAKVQKCKTLNNQIENWLITGVGSDAA